MGQRVFFSFHYERDVHRVNLVRSCWVTGSDRAEAGIWHPAIWQRIKQQGDDAIRRTIDEGLRDTSVTLVLIGAETAYRPWVHHQVRESIERGNAIVGIRIHNIPDPRNGQRDVAGPNPLDLYANNRVALGLPRSFSWPVYDWRDDNGFANLARWIEAAALQLGRPLSA
jgi:hypothetical protein